MSLNSPQSFSCMNRAARTSRISLGPCDCSLERGFIPRIWPFPPLLSFIKILVFSLVQLLRLLHKAQDLFPNGFQMEKDIKLEVLMATVLCL